MPAYRKWKVVTAGGEKTGLRSENKTYEWLREWASYQPEGTKADVYVQDGERWLTFERHVVRSGLLDTY